jgi:3-hydroxyacyl-[acyl-carrier-protein] dehydratase
MPAAPLIDFTTIELNRILVSKEEIYKDLPHRFEFMQLDGIVHVDREAEIAVAVREVREDEFWVKGHIPGRPLMPGVLMIETAAQLASYMSRVLQPSDRFIGFGGIDAVKFRQAVTPPARMYFVVKAVELRPRRIICDSQAFLNGQMAFEGRITGMPV